MGVVGQGAFGDINIGTIGHADIAQASTENYGVVGIGRNTSDQGVGGYFTMQSRSQFDSSKPSISAALIANNGDQSAIIFAAQDNGTNVFEIADGGEVRVIKDFATTSKVVSLTADDTVITASDTSYIALSSDSAVATDRTFTLTAGADGQRLTIVFTGANAAELLDAGIHKLSADFLPTGDDTLDLISDGTDWYELSVSAN